MTRPRNARLTARPRQSAVAAPLGAATHRLGLSAERDGLLHVPAGLQTARPAPLIVMLHGAGGGAGSAIPMLVAEAEARDFLVLAPESRRSTWDLLSDRAYGPDVDYIDAALEHVFGRFTVSKVALAGFSDGASYALSVGLANGDLFSDVLAFSPGFMAPDPILSRPAVFVSHGVDDRVLPIERCGRPVAERLRRAGYDVDYREFNGGHTVPAPLVEAAVGRFLS